MLRQTQAKDEDFRDCVRLVLALRTYRQNTIAHGLLEPQRLVFTVEAYGY